MKKFTFQGIQRVTYLTFHFSVFVFALRWLTIFCFLGLTPLEFPRAMLLNKLFYFALGKIINYGNGNQKATSATKCGNQNRHILLPILLSSTRIYSCHGRGEGFFWGGYVTG